MTSQRQRRLIVREAAQFIRARRRDHRLQFALEVGEHLFVNVYRGNRAFYKRGGRTESKTIGKIARDRRVRIPPRKLYACIHTYLLSLQYKRVTNLPFPE